MCVHWFLSSMANHSPLVMPCTARDQGDPRPRSRDRFFKLDQLDSPNTFLHLIAHFLLSKENRSIVERRIDYGPLSGFGSGCQAGIPRATAHDEMHHRKNLAPTRLTSSLARRP
jgi:hypothetical protein